MLQAELRFIGWSVVTIAVIGAAIAADIACITIGHLSDKAALALTIGVLLATGYGTFALWLRSYEKSQDLPRSQRREARYAPILVPAAGACFQIYALIITSPHGMRDRHSSNGSYVILWMSLAIAVTCTLLAWRNQRRGSASPAPSSVGSHRLR